LNPLVADGDEGSDDEDPADGSGMTFFSCFRFLLAALTAGEKAEASGDADRLRGESLGRVRSAAVAFSDSGSSCLMIRAGERRCSGDDKQLEEGVSVELPPPPEEDDESSSSDLAGGRMATAFAAPPLATVDALG